MLPFRRLVVLIMVITLVVAVLPPIIRAQEATPAPRFTNTVEVEGRRIGLSCEGGGSPTVVLIGGARSPADLVWPETVDALSSLTRVCAFERAGLGASDPQPRSPQTAADVVADLHGALDAAGEDGPFVPVGFHFGGLVARLYASTYPDEVAGLVLVEGVPPGLNIVDLTAGEFVSSEEQEGIRAIMTGRDPFAPSSPVDMVLSEAQVVAAPAPPRVPTITVVGGRIEELSPEEFPGGVVPWGHLEYVARTFERQAAQARDLGARVIIAPDSDLFVPFNQPDVMIAAIEDVVEAVRDPGRWDTPAEATPAP
jgi:hypothetical protein